MVYGEVVLAEEVRAARHQAFKHLLLGVVGGAVAGWVWMDPWRVLSILPGLRGIVTFLAVAAALYELVVGAQFWQKASRLEEAPRMPSPDLDRGLDRCRRCVRPLLPGAGSCAVCGEPV